jgi:dTDP-4-amino-4,6-dideoxygalactose transaminase
VHVPFADLAAQSRAIKAELWPVWQEIFDAAEFIGGEQVDQLEGEFAAAAGAAHCVAVHSGTDALRFILLALGLRPGDEVITVPNTFIATTEAITQAGGVPVFVDVDPATYNLDPARLDAAITRRTRGIVPVHLYGQPADMDPILEIAERHGVWVVEDACQAHLAEYKGRRVGSLARAAAFSFYPGKNLGACGEGGAVTTGDAALAARVRMLRDHGQAKKYHHDIEGYNGRLDSMQCAVVRIKLKHLPAWNEARRRHAARYRMGIGNTPAVTLPHVADGCLPVFHLFVIQVDERDRVAERLKVRGIHTALHYPIPLHCQRAYAHRGIPAGSFPVSERCATRVLSLPMFPELTDDQIDYVCAGLASAVG